MRISEAALLLTLSALAACDEKLPDKTGQAQAAAERKAYDEAEGRIDCRPPGASDFARVCALDRRQTQDGLYLTIRHPDGGFRRLIVTSDGRGVAAADGAEPAVVTPIGSDEIEVVLGGGVYRLPATVKQPGKPK